MISIMFHSLTGNTLKLAETIKGNLKRDIDYFGELDLRKALESDVLFIGFYTDKGRASLKVQEVIKELKNKQVFLFGTCGFGVSDDYFQTVLSRVLEDLDKSNQVIGTYMCQGKMPISVKNRYLALKESGKEIPNIDLLIKNFDDALSHPNQEDLRKLAEIIRNLNLNV